MTHCLMSDLSLRLGFDSRHHCVRLFLFARSDRWNVWVQGFPARVCSSFSLGLCKWGLCWPIVIRIEVISLTNLGMKMKNWGSKCTSLESWGELSIWLHRSSSKVTITYFRWCRANYKVLIYDFSLNCWSLYQRYWRMEPTVLLPECKLVSSSRMHFTPKTPAWS